MRDRKELEDVLATSLSDLGRNGSEVAASLNALGIVGEPADSECCPLANFLTQECSVWYAQVGDDFVVCGDNYGYVSIPAPLACVDFIHAFDRCEYPGLIGVDG